jgi:hypothetical protein
LSTSLFQARDDIAHGGFIEDGVDGEPFVQVFTFRESDCLF